MRNSWFLLLTLLLTGCAAHNPPTRYYLLQPLIPKMAMTPVTTDANNPLPPGEGRVRAFNSRDQSAEHKSAPSGFIGIGPVTLRRYLNRNPIITAVGDGELHLAEFEHWAEPLQDNVAQVLAENLGRLSGALQVLSYPWPHNRAVDVQIEVDVSQFHAEADGTVLLSAQWSLYRHETLLHADRSDIRLPANHDDYRAIAIRQSEALAALSREIAAALPRGLLDKTE